MIPIHIMLQATSEVDEYIMLCIISITMVYTKKVVVVYHVCQKCYQKIGHRKDDISTSKS